MVGYAAGDASNRELVGYTAAMSLRRQTMDSYDYEEYDGEGYSLFSGTHR